MRRRKLYFFNRFFRPDNSATAQILTDLCADLDRDKFSLTVVTSRLNYGDPSIRYAHSEELDGIQVFRVWSTRFGRGSLLGRLTDYLTVYLSMFAFLLRETTAEDICIFKTDPPLLSIPGAVARNIRGFKMVSWCQDIFPEVAQAEIRPLYGTRWIFKCLAAMRDWSLAVSQCVVVIGEDMADYLVKRGISDEKIRTISNWSVQKDEEITKESTLRADWGIEEGTFVVGYSGNLGRAHDWRTIHSAATRLKSEEGLLFLCCGGGHGYEQLRQAVEESGLGKLFHFLPYQPFEDLASSLKVPDVHWLTLKGDLSPFIFPSKFFGILQAGRAMIFIGSATCEISRLVESHQIGSVVEEGEGESLAGVIREMKADRERTRLSGDRARSLWKTDYRKSLEIDKWETLLSEPGMQGETENGA